MQSFFSSPLRKNGSYDTRTKHPETKCPQNVQGQNKTSTDKISRGTKRPRAKHPSEKTSSGFKVFGDKTSLGTKRTQEKSPTMKLEKTYSTYSYYEKLCLCLNIKFCVIKHENQPKI